jgi:hypothetical protein
VHVERRTVFPLFFLFSLFFLTFFFKFFPVLVPLVEVMVVLERMIFLVILQLAEAATTLAVVHLLQERMDILLHLQLEADGVQAFGQDWAQAGCSAICSDPALEVQLERPPERLRDMVEPEEDKTKQIEKPKRNKETNKLNHLRKFSNVFHKFTHTTHLNCSFIHWEAFSAETRRRKKKKQTKSQKQKGLGEVLSRVALKTLTPDTSRVLLFFSFHPPLPSLLLPLPLLLSLSFLSSLLLSLLSANGTRPERHQEVNRHLFGLAFAVYRFAAEQRIL